MRGTLIAVCVIAAGCTGQPETSGGSGGSSGGSQSTSEVGSSSSGPAEATSSSSGTDGESSGGSGTTGPTPNEPPVAVARLQTVSGVSGWTAVLDGSQSTDPDGEIASWSWSWDGSSAEGETVSATFDAVGCVEVTLTVTDEQGATGSDTVVVSTVAAAPPMMATASFGDSPRPSALLPRDLRSGSGTARFAGTVETDGFAEVRANVSVGGVVTDTVAVPICGPVPAPFVLDVPIPAELAAHDVQVVAAVGDAQVELAVVPDLVAGDVYLVNGQSNAFAAMYAGDANVNQTPFLRSFGVNETGGVVTQDDTNWYPAAGNGAAGPGGIGQWAIRMASALSEAHGVPIAVLNGSLGGQPIGYFQRNDADPTDLSTNYGRLLYRMQAAGLAEHVRGILWYQGESDGLGTMVHQEGFEALLADWAQDYPGPEQIYVTQLRAGCGAQTIGIQEYQRTLPDRMDGITVMSTTGLDGHDGCHYAYAQGYEVLGNRYAALLGRDLYGETPGVDVQPPNPLSATLEAGGTEISIQLRNDAEPMVFEPGAQADFRLEGSAVTVTGGTAQPGEIRLTLSGDASGASGISYLGHALAGPWVRSEAGLGLLTFLDLPLD